MFLRDKNNMKANGTMARLPTPPGAVPVVSIGLSVPNKMRMTYSTVIKRYMNGACAFLAVLRAFAALDTHYFKNMIIILLLNIICRKNIKLPIIKADFPSFKILTKVIFKPMPAIAIIRA